MRAVLLVARSEAWRRKGALLGPALVVALVGTAVIAAGPARRAARRRPAELLRVE